MSNTYYGKFFISSDSAKKRCESIGKSLLAVYSLSSLKSLFHDDLIMLDMGIYLNPHGQRHRPIIYWFINDTPTPLVDHKQNCKNMMQMKQMVYSRYIFESYYENIYMDLPGGLFEYNEKLFCTNILGFYPKFIKLYWRISSLLLKS